MLKISDITDEAHLERLLRLVPEWVKSPGLERVGWLNAIIKKAWPHIDTVAVDQFRQNIWPVRPPPCMLTSFLRGC